MTGSARSPTRRGSRLVAANPTRRFPRARPPSPPQSTALNPPPPPPPRTGVCTGPAVRADCGWGVRGRTRATARRGPGHGCAARPPLRGRGRAPRPLRPYKPLPAPCFAVRLRLCAANGTVVLETAAVPGGAVPARAELRPAGGAAIPAGSYTVEPPGRTGVAEHQSISSPRAGDERGRCGWRAHADVSAAWRRPASAVRRHPRWPRSRPQSRGSELSTGMACSPPSPRTGGDERRRCRRCGCHVGPAPRRYRRLHQCALARLARCGARAPGCGPSPPAAPGRPGRREAPSASRARDRMEAAAKRAYARVFAGTAGGPDVSWIGCTRVIDGRADCGGASGAAHLRPVRLAFTRGLRLRCS